MNIFAALTSVVKSAPWAIVTVVAIIALSFTGCYLFGCQQASVVETYASRSPEQHSTKTGEVIPSEKLVSRKTTHTRVMTWAGSSPGETIAQMQALEVTDDGAKFSGMKPFDLAKKGPMLLIYVGIGLAVIGLGLIVFLPGARTTGIYAAAGGGAFVVAGIAFESYPWLALAIVGLAVVGGLAWFLLGTAAGARTRAALRAVVAGVARTETTNPEAAEAVKANIGTAASGAGKTAVVKAAVAATKRTI